MDPEKEKRFQKLRHIAAPRFIFGFAAVVLIFSLLNQSADLDRLKTEFPVVIYHGEKEPFQIQFQKSRPHTWTSLGNISRSGVGAVIVSEDWSFFQHNGLDFNQIQEAVEDAVEEGGRLRGASTLTQQVVKNVFLTQERSFIRKFREFILAPQLEKAVGKRRVLETYFNIAEWGYGIFGIQKASYHYFNKPPSELLPREGAFLAMLLPSPKKYSISHRQKSLTRFARRQINRILDKMRRGGYITQETFDLEVNAPLSFEENSPITH